ncbi:2-phospho-L-lactate guanylyltransferase [Marisediminicola sp. UYEF4]|uniref:2-phospho-L-lactate guanylyltransferase n=1 Tax=Marisediminicola sp. UYEF4 TaxID=1756384 RepID=UPI00339323E0
MSWTIVIPVKRLDEAKSRLRPDLADVADLALAFATDTIVAARNSVLVDEVIVVTPDARVVERATALGAWIVPDPGTGLNAAATAGIRAARTRCVAVLTGDLPALDTADLDRALHLAELFELSMVADHGGIGTTLIASSNGAALEPRFGPSSRERHEAAGHAVLALPVGSALRWDVDTVTDLATALTLGVGEATASVVSTRAGHPA